MNGSIVLSVQRAAHATAHAMAAAVAGDGLSPAEVVERVEELCTSPWPYRDPLTTS